MNTNWLLLAALLLGVVLAWVAGRFGASTLTESPEFSTQLAQRISGDSNLSAQLANSSAVGGVVHNAVDTMVRDGSLAEAVVQSDQLRSYVDSMMMELDNNSTAQDDVAALVKAEVARVTKSGTAVAAGTGSKQELARVQRAMRSYESKLASLATKVEDDESAAVVNTMQGQLFELQGLIDNLSEDVRCVVANAGGGARNFLLKERRSTNLAGVDLMVTLGRLRKGVLDSVAISGTDTSNQSSTAVKANVRIGSPFEFQANGRAYDGVLTYSQGRWGPDFVGLEISADPMTGEC